MQNALTGIITPLATPFTKDGDKVDFPAYRKLIDALIASGAVSAIIANAATGQFASLSDDERAEVATTAVDQAAGRVPVFIGAGAPSTHESIRWTKHAEKLGALGVMIMPPYYGPTPAPVAVKHYAAISQACALPIMIYNAPYASQFIMMPEHIEAAVKSANIKWVKLTTGAIDHVTWLRTTVGDKIQVYEGVDPLAFPSFCLGANGWIAGPSNMIPEITAEMWKRVQAGDLTSARRLQDKIFPLLQTMRENMAYGSVINEVCRLRGLDLGPVRLPGLPLEGNHLKRVHDAAKALGVAGVPIGQFDAAKL